MTSFKTAKKLKKKKKLGKGKYMACTQDKGLETNLKEEDKNISFHLRKLIKEQQ